jgi:Protein of unknown function (DUF402)
MRWVPGEVVVWREAWRGREYIRIPVRVVRDDEREFAFYLCEGTRYGFPPGSWPFGDAHPWAAQGEFEGHGILVWQRPGAAHTIWHFWEGDERAFAGWYVNLQEPFRRRDRSFVTQDQELDIWIEPDGSWRWKDEEQLEEWVQRGRFTRDEVQEIRAEGERVLAEWPFPTGWEDWQPDHSWEVPELPVDWAR